jgi:hypothetical protein
MPCHTLSGLVLHRARSPLMSAGHIVIVCGALISP